MKTILKAIGIVIGWFTVLGLCIAMIDGKDYSTKAREQEWVVIQARNIDCGIGQIAADCIRSDKPVSGGKNAKKKVVVR